MQSVKTVKKCVVNWKFNPPCYVCCHKLNKSLNFSHILVSGRLSCRTLLSQFSNDSTP